MNYVSLEIVSLCLILYLSFTTGLFSFPYRAYNTPATGGTCYYASRQLIRTYYDQVFYFSPQGGSIPNAEYANSFVNIYSTVCVTWVQGGTPSPFPETSSTWTSLSYPVRSQILD